MSDKPIKSVHQLSLQDQSTEFLLYTTPNGQIKVEVLLSNETLWLTQKRMAELFGVGVPAISKHLKIFLKAMSCKLMQLFPFWKQLLKMAKITKSSIIIWMQSFP